MSTFADPAYYSCLCPADEAESRGEGPSELGFCNLTRGTGSSMSERLGIERFIPTLEALAGAGGVSVLTILAALRNAAIWEIVGGGPHTLEGVWGPLEATASGDNRRPRHSCQPAR